MSIYQTEEIENIRLDKYEPEDFVELYVSALLLIADGCSVEEAHTSVTDVREQLNIELEFEAEPIPPGRLLH